MIKRMFGRAGVALSAAQAGRPGSAEKTANHPMSQSRSGVYFLGIVLWWVKVPNLLRYLLYDVKPDVWSGVCGWGLSKNALRSSPTYWLRLPRNRMGPVVWQPTQ